MACRTCTDDEWKAWREAEAAKAKAAPKGAASSSQDDDPGGMRHYRFELPEDWRVKPHVSGDYRMHGPKDFSGVVRTSNRVLKKMYNQWQSELEASDQAHAEENRVATLHAAQLQCEKTQQSATLASALEAEKTLKSAKARLEAILEMEKQSNKLAFSEAEKRHKMALDAAEKQHEIEKVAIFKELKEKHDKEQRDAVSMAKQAARQKIRGIENDYLGFKVKVDTSIKAWRKKVGKLRYDLKVKEAELQRERAKKNTQTAYLMLQN